MNQTNWGKYPVIEAPEYTFRPGLQPEQIETPWIPRGMGRCYGDSSLGESMLSILAHNRFLSFDEQNGILCAEAGVTFEDLLETFVPKGWFPPVTPGTKFVSLGGALASDVHGKNHHKEGSIGRHVIDFELMLADGQVIRCSREENPQIFQATLGGMGLTGLILTVTLRLKPIETAYINMHSIKARNLEEIMDLFETHASVTYSVAWIDCLSKGAKMGRSILMLGEHASREQLTSPKLAAQPLQLPKQRRITIPFNFPNFTLNPLTIKAFNFLYYHKQLKKEVKQLAHYEGFFYPLDMLNHWNRIYGKRGFTQYQFAIPRENGKQGMTDILNRIVKQGLGSFLAVLKAFGPQEGMMSFPMEGYTLALDFPITQTLFPFLDELDKMVADLGGRVYLTKDVRMKREMLAKTYPHLDEFEALLKELDPQQQIRSLQSERLGMHPREEL
jgi:decaprenylphospho-beta-D-ribofuranose 2-oxidase